MPRMPGLTGFGVYFYVVLNTSAILSLRTADKLTRTAESCVPKYISLEYLVIYVSCQNLIG